MKNHSLARGLVLAAALFVFSPASATPPFVVITSPMNEASVTAFTKIRGTVTNDVAVTGMRIVLKEIDPTTGGNRWWNGAGWQLSAFPLAVTVAGTNWTNAASVTLPPVNSGLSYEITASATDSLAQVSSVIATVHTPIEVLTWDPGATHLGTQVKYSSNALGGVFIYKIVTQGTTVGG